MKVDAARVREIFDYRPDGTLVWKINTGKKRLIGTVAGCARGPDGYRRVGLYGKDYYLHHLVWAWHHGVWPKRLDYKNGDSSHNRIDNLREANQSQNTANSKRQIRMDRPKGVHPVRGACTWRAQIMVNGQSMHLGSYLTQEEAHHAYVVAAEHFFKEFARAA